MFILSPFSFGDTAEVWTIIHSRIDPPTRPGPQLAAQVAVTALLTALPALCLLSGHRFITAGPDPPPTPGATTCPRRVSASPFQLPGQNLISWVNTDRQGFPLKRGKCFSVFNYNFQNQELTVEL